MRSILWFGLQGLAYQRGDGLVGDASRAASLQFVMKPLDSMLKVAPTPEAHRLLTQAKFVCNSETGQPFRGHKNKPRTYDQCVRKRSGARHGCQLLGILLGQHHG